MFKSQKSKVDNFDNTKEKLWKIPLFAAKKKSGYFIGFSATLSRGAELRLVFSVLCCTYYIDINPRLTLHIIQEIL